MSACSRRCSGNSKRCRSRCSAFPRKRPIRVFGKTPTARSNGVAVTSKTLPFVAAFDKRYGNNPSYCGYTAYDEVYYIAEAIKRAGSTDPDKLVDALEKTDYVGTIGRIQFKGKDSPNPHALKIGPETITGLMLQW